MSNEPTGPNVSDQRGEWIQTYSGGLFYPFDPSPDDVRIEDIAHALSNQCRFAGHCINFYSVAEHSVRVSRATEPLSPLGEPRRLLALCGLLHDASEAYLVDIPRPIKAHPLFSFYRSAEKRVQSAIWQRFGLSEFATADGGTEPAEVKRADTVLLATEFRDLMNTVEGWRFEPAEDPLSERIEPWAALHAERRFLDRFKELSK